MNLIFMLSLILVVASLLSSTSSADDTKKHHEYCVIGAGPGGLQMAYFLQQAGRDYIVFEKGQGAGTFYTKFPIHRTLISINKRNTGKTNKEFNLRHDWNSLVSHDESLRIGLYTKEIFPDADIFVQYLNDFVQKLDINVKFNTTIKNLNKRDPVDKKFHVSDQHDKEYTCKYVIVATGIAKPKQPEGLAWENEIISYEDLTLNLDDYEGKSVLILGRGNSAFETAQYIIGRTNFIHMVSRERLKLAWSTHYVGDLRAVNNGLLDTYQLKSLDGLIERDVRDLPLRKSEINGRLYLDPAEIHRIYGKLISDNNSLREGYDMVISCLGFEFDDSIFHSNATVNRAGTGRLQKYPRMTRQYESSNIPGIYYAGTNTHTLDYRLSAGGFIHGFRYTTRTLHRILENRHHDIAWPAIHFKSAIEVIPHMLKRVNEASDIYQMFSVLCEIIIFSEDGNEAIYLEAYPCVLVSQIPKVTGHPVPGKLVIVAMEYGKNASGPGKDVFSEDRSTLEAVKAHFSNFLHPVLYYYDRLPTDAEISRSPKKWILPIPTRIHHIVEDFTTVFDGPVTHVLALRRFFENILDRDLRQYYVHQCMTASLVSTTLPESCRIYDLNGRGISASEQMKDKLAYMDPWIVQKTGTFMK